MNFTRLGGHAIAAGYRAGAPFVPLRQEAVDRAKVGVAFLGLVRCTARLTAVPWRVFCVAETLLFTSVTFLVTFGPWGPLSLFAIVRALRGVAQPFFAQHE